MAGGDDCAHRSRLVLRRGRARETSRARRPSGCDWRPSGQSGAGRGRVARGAPRGDQAGNPLAEASVRCPDAVFLDGAFDAYFAASLDVDDVLRRVSPTIEWVSIDEVFVGFPPGIAARARSRPSNGSTSSASAGIRRLVRARPLEDGGAGGIAARAAARRGARPRRVRGSVPLSSQDRNAPRARPGARAALRARRDPAPRPDREALRVALVVARRTGPRSPARPRSTQPD